MLSPYMSSESGIINRLWGFGLKSGMVVETTTKFGGEMMTEECRRDLVSMSNTAKV